jgi:hypothetical protein
MLGGAMSPSDPCLPRRPKKPINTFTCVFTPPLSGYLLHRGGLLMIAMRKDCRLDDMPLCQATLLKGIWRRAIVQQHHLDVGQACNYPRRTK